MKEDQKSWTVKNVPMLQQTSLIRTNTSNPINIRDQNLNVKIVKKYFSVKLN